MGSHIGFVNDKTNGHIRPPTTTGLLNVEFLFSHIKPGLMKHFAMHAAVVRMSGIGWISSNEGVFVMFQITAEKRPGVHNGPSLELTWRAPKMSGY